MFQLSGIQSVVALQAYDCSFCKRKKNESTYQLAYPYKRQEGRQLFQSNNAQNAQGKGKGNVAPRKQGGKGKEITMAVIPCVSDAVSASSISQPSNQLAPPRQQQQLPPPLTQEQICSSHSMASVMHHQNFQESIKTIITTASFPLFDVWNSTSFQFCFVFNPALLPIFSFQSTIVSTANSGTAPQLSVSGFNNAPPDEFQQFSINYHNLSPALRCLEFNQFHLQSQPSTHFFLPVNNSICHHR